MNPLLIALLLSAEPFTDDELKSIEEYNGQVSGMADRAVIKGKIPWCDGPFLGDPSWDHGRMRRAIGTRVPQADAFVQLCELPDDPSYQKAAALAVQKVMNEYGDKKQAPAIERIKKWIVAWKNEKDGVQPSEEEKFAFTENSFNVAKAEPGVEAVQPGSIDWCDGIDVDDDRWDANRIGRTVGGQYGIDGTVQGAAHLCLRKDDATWKQEGAYVLQKWINWTGQSKADAIKSLNARGKPAFVEQQKALCKALELDPEASGSEAVFGKAKLAFFGCSNELAPQWQERKVVDDLRFSLDPLAEVPSEIVRAAYLFSAVPSPTEWPDTFPSKDASENTPLLRYAMVQRDFQQLDEAALGKELADAPYNDAARVIANENLAKLRRAQKAYAEAVEKMTKKDEDLAQILVKAPVQGAAAWDKAAAQWKAELARSNAFETKLGQPSRKALKGCMKELRPDAQKLIKAMKSTDYKELIAKLSTDLAASLLLSRLAVCAAYEKINGLSGPLADIVSKGRDVRGPRTAAYYAIIDALAEAKKDRPKLVLQLENFSLWDNQSLPNRYRGEFEFSGALPYDPEQTGARGTVASISKVAEGVQLTFKHTSYSYPEANCVDDKYHPLRIESNGTISYAQHCKYTGKMLTMNTTPSPVVIAPELATGVKAGVYVNARELSTRSKSGPWFAAVDFTKRSASDKKVETFYGFDL